MLVLGNGVLGMIISQPVYEATRKFKIETWTERNPLRDIRRDKAVWFCSSR
jgi:hypothetical protein